MSVLICGSLAYDAIMAFPDRFQNHILPSQIHILNVSFLVPELRREMGGCAGNIAYNLHLLGGTPLIMATVGQDFGPYAEWLDQCGIDRRHIRTVKNTYTAQAFITTDQDSNQITLFHPGAMSFSHENRVEEAKNVKLGILSPDGREGMIEHARQFHEANIPFMFDPGQGLPMFDGQDLIHFLDLATWAIFNDYEAKLSQERTGLSLESMADQVEALIVTRGAQGSSIYTQGKCIEIPPTPVDDAVDPTGCGDAFRGGLLYGLSKEMPWETSGRLASLMGAIKVEHPGTQNHRTTLEEIHKRFHSAFGFDF
ncbi:adenosine kinase [Gammaproteobacteria bacterium]